MSSALRAAVAAGALALAALTCLAPAVAPHEAPVTTDVATGNAAFARDLYAKLRVRSGNLFFSPYSISTALAMTRAGARGETAAEMTRALHLPARGANAAFQDLQSHLRGTGDYQLVVANRLWGQTGYGFRPSYVALARDRYGAGLEEVSFSRAPDAARRRINAWVERETRGKIQNLIGPGVLTRLTRLVLTNAIYFKGAWENPFEASATHDAPFTTPAGRVRVPTMEQSDSFRYGEIAGAQILQMPYKGGDVSMVVVLPCTASGLPALERRLLRERVTAKALAAWDRQLEERSVHVFLPRFRITTTFQLADELTGLGIRRAFRCEGAKAADFTGLSTRRDLCVSAVVHKAYVDVDEKGTEAAAATGVVMGTTSIREPVRPVVFRADHPFLFVLWHAPTHSILFAGRVTDPRG